MTMPMPLFGHSSQIRQVACSAITVGERFRQDMGSLDELASSIDGLGLLQPIGITATNQLVFGERRLRAVRDVLGRKVIDARVVDVESILSGEYVENEVRKDFTVSERVAIGTALEAELGERRGKRDNCPVLKRDLAAEKAGFESGKTYERAKSVVEHGTPKLVEAMDSGKLAVSAAALVAKEPAEVQDKVASASKKDVKSILSDMRNGKLPTPLVARRVARETGKATPDNTGMYRTGATPEEERAEGQMLIRNANVTNGIASLAGKYTATRIATDLFKFECKGLGEQIDAALVWLPEFKKELEKRGKISTS